MDDLIRIRAAKTILQRGVRVATLRTPLSFWLRGLPWRYTLVLHQPTLAELVEIGELIVRMGVDQRQLQHINLTDSYYLVNGTAELAAQALLVAARFKHPLISRERAVKWLLKTIDATDFEQAWTILVLHSGTADFTDTTRLILTMDNLTPTTQRSGQPDQSPE